METINVTCSPEGQQHRQYGLVRGKGGKVDIFIVCQKVEWFMIYSMQWRAICMSIWAAVCLLNYFLMGLLKNTTPATRAATRTTATTTSTVVDIQRLQLDQLRGPEPVQGPATATRQRLNMPPAVLGISGPALTWANTNGMPNCYGWTNSP